MKCTTAWIAASMSLIIAGIAPGALAAAGARNGAADAAVQDNWAGFLDYAYIYSSAEPAALEARLARYAAQAGLTLRDYVKERIEDRERRGATLSESERRRQAIAWLLDYRATGEQASLQASVAAIRELDDRLDRKENRYWHHYIRAHDALEQGDAAAFTREVLDLWLYVVVELEAPYDTYQVLSLNRSQNAGFVASLPYLYENIARLVLIQTQRMGVHDGLDALAGVVRSLAEDRVGSDPSTIPAAASAKDYLDAIVARLDGPESDGQALSFTLALFEAGAAHERMRGLLASEGLGDDTLEAARLSIGAYENALGIADTLQGQVAVYTRALRQLGELYAARQRLSQEVDLQVPFSIERAIDIYAALHADLDDWEKHGYRNNGREAYLGAMVGLWEEIQEASFNAADYHLTRGIALRSDGDADLAEAASRHVRYLSFHRTYAGDHSAAGVPDSAYFAAHRALRGIADSLLFRSAGNPSVAQVEKATSRYREALALYPFDPDLWSALATTLERQGRETEFLALAKPVADAVVRSSALETWVAEASPKARELDVVRRALANDLSLMYLGFTDVGGVERLAANLAAVVFEVQDVEEDLRLLQTRRDALGATRGQQLAGVVDAAVPAATDVDAEVGLPAVSAGVPMIATSREIGELDDRIADLAAERARLSAQVAASSMALPLFSDAIEVEGLAWELSAQRNHPVHSVIRRMAAERERRAL